MLVLRVRGGARIARLRGLAEWREEDLWRNGRQDRGLYVRAEGLHANSRERSICAWLEPSGGSMVHVTVRVRTMPDRALPRKCGTRQKSWLPRRTKCPRTW